MLFIRRSSFILLWYTLPTPVQAWLLVFYSVNRVAWNAWLTWNMRHYTVNIQLWTSIFQYRISYQCEGHHHELVSIVQCWIAYGHRFPVIQCTRLPHFALYERIVILNNFVVGILCARFCYCVGNIPGGK